jgi:Ca2+-binding EF-hand superfamily protein
VFIPQTLDTEGNGYLDSEKLKELLGGGAGGGLKEKELDAFLKVAADKVAGGRVYYEDYVALMSR